MWRRKRRPEDFSEEIRAHLAIEADRLREQGLSEEDALAAARRAFGNVTAAEERFYETGRWRWLDQLRQDVRGGLRLWRKRPLAATAAILTIALGTGMNVALFRVVWSALLKPLPYPGADRLVQVWLVNREGGRDLPRAQAIELWRTRSQSFETLASFRPWRATVGSGGDPDRVAAGLVSAEFFPLLGVPAPWGRRDDNVAVLSNGYWRERFGSDRKLVGRSIVIDGQLCRVAGVLPEGFRDIVTSGSRQPDVYLPISKMATGSLKLSSGFVVGRLKADVGIEAARSELAALAREAGREEDAPPWREAARDVRITPLQDEIGLAVRPALLALFAATGCILLIACTNVANLLLAQAVARRRELAIRSALGAGRMRLVRQLLTEALLLALAGGLAGLCAAVALTRGLIVLYPGTLPRVAEGGAGGPVLLFALLTATASAAFFGILPALLATRGRRQAKRWVGQALVGLQVAVTAMVLIAAGLLLRSLVALRSIELGFEHARLLTAQVVLPDARYRTKEDRARFAALWVEQLQSIPGVEHAAVTNSLPLAYNLLMTVSFTAPGQPTERPTGARAVTGEYFDALGLRMKEGRPLTPADDGRKDVVVVNESFVRRFLNGTGTTIRFGPDKSVVIVGVVRDLHNLGLARSAEPEIYLPFASLPAAYLDVVVRTALPSDQIAAAARSRLRALDSGLALAQVSTMDRILDDNIAAPRFHAVLVGLFAAVAIALAAVGVYGVIAQGVRARTAEFGIRLALGARAAGVFGMVVRQGMHAPIIGLAVGLAGAWACGRVLETLLYGVTPHDPLVLAGTAAFLLVVCVTGCALPALHASRTDPARALRDE